MNSSESRQLEQWLRNIKQRSGVEISVFIPKSLQDREIADFSIQVAEQWKLGRKKEDKALLLVIAPKERKMRIEVGYGLEGDVTDAFSKRVLDDVMRPYFREGRYAEGIAATLVALQEKVPLGIDEPSAPAQREKRFARHERRGVTFKDIFVIGFWIFIVFLFVGLRIFGLIPAYHGGRGRGGWGGGFGGGGGSSWGGGGGGFGGGGASSSW